MLTLQELKKIVDVPERGKNPPTAKQLQSAESLVVNEKLGTDGEIRVYANGYALYRICSRSTVFSVHSCGDYLYLSDEGMVHLAGDFFEGERWYLRLVLEGEDRLGRNQEERERNFSYSIVSEEWATMEDASESALDHLVKQETVGEMLQLLTEKQRTVIQRYYIQGKTQVQISKELGISRLAVRDSIFHAIGRIRKKYPLEACLLCHRAECGVGR